MGATLPQCNGILERRRLLRLVMSLVAGTCGVCAVALGLHAEDAPAGMTRPIAMLTAKQEPHHSGLRSSVVGRSLPDSRSAPEDRTTGDVLSQVPIQPGLGGVPRIKTPVKHMAASDLRFQLMDAASAARHREVSAEEPVATPAILWSTGHTS